MKFSLLALSLVFLVSVSSMQLTLTQIKKIMPSAKESLLKSYLPYINEAMAWGKINTCPRIAAFIAQTAQETGEFVEMTEKTSGKAYEGRCKDLGNCHRGDGPKFIGRGALQITGREDYQKVSKALGVDFVKNPKLVGTAKYGFKTSAWYWTNRNLNKLADQNTQKAYDQITRKINGCIHCKVTHKDVRDRYWRKAKQVLGC